MKIVLLAIAIVILTGCSQDKPKDPGVLPQKSVTVLGEYEELYQKCKKFRDEHPEYKEIRCGKDNITFKVK